MKSNTPAFQFYPQDFLVGTAMLSAEETGAYIRLLCYQWTNDGLPNDKAILARIAGCDGNAVGSVWDKFGICHDGKLRNARLESIRVKQNEYRAKQKANSEKRWKSEENGKVGIPTDIPSHQSGISQVPSQTDALHSSSSYTNTLSKDIVLVGGNNNSNDDAMAIPPHEAEKVEEPKPKRKRQPKTIDAEWIADLKRHYPDIAIDSELGKMEAWCSANNREMTRKFVVGWLNRHKPTAPQPPKNDIPPEYDFSW